MNFETIEDVYEVNAKIRRRFLETIAGLPEELVARAAPDGRWSIEQVLEHVSIVDEGMVKICAKLLRKAQADGSKGDGRPMLSEQFLRKAAEFEGAKVEAPAIVQPVTGRSAAESVARLEESQRILDEIMELFLTCDGTAHTFPHPYLGALCAHEWLVLRGQHELRHLRQIERMAAENKKGPGYEEGE